MKKNYNDYLKTDYWRAVSDAVKKRADYRCQICNSQHDLQAHHRTYDHRGREMEFLADLTCLCRRCHGVFHGKIEITPAAVQPVPESRKTRNQNKREASLARFRQLTPAEISEIERDMPMDGGKQIVLTHELMIKLRTSKYGYTNATLRVLGLKAPLIKGWVQGFYGKELPREEFRRALEGRYKFNSGPL